MLNGVEYSILFNSIQSIQLANRISDFWWLFNCKGLRKPHAEFRYVCESPNRAQQALTSNNFEWIFRCKSLKRAPLSTKGFKLNLVHFISFDKKSYTSFQGLTPTLTFQRFEPEPGAKMYKHDFRDPNALNLGHIITHESVSCLLNGAQRELIVKWVCHKVSCNGLFQTLQECSNFSSKSFTEFADQNRLFESLGYSHCVALGMARCCTKPFVKKPVKKQVRWSNLERLNCRNLETKAEILERALTDKADFLKYPLSLIKLTATKLKLTLNLLIYLFWFCFSECQPCGGRLLRVSLIAITDRSHRNIERTLSELSEQGREL